MMRRTGPGKGSGVQGAERLVKERRARLAAERLLDQKSRELALANDRLSTHALRLSEKVADQRQTLQAVQTEAAELQGTNVQMKSDLARALSAATLAQRRLWEAVETFRDGFAVFDTDQKLIIANGAYVAMFAVQGGNEGGGEGGGGTELQAGMLYSDIIRLMADGGIVDLGGRDPADWHHEMMERAGTDPVPPLVLGLSDGRSLRLIDRRGETGDLVCLTADITETVLREAELEEARARAEAASRAKSAFLANMSHEIRTPMNGVVGMADLLCETSLTEDQRLFAETIKSSGEALLTIINDVLDYSKAEAERLRLSPEPFDLERCLYEITLLLQPRAREKGIDLLVDFDLFLPTRFVADPGRMRQILTNLIGNAVKFTPRGHVLTRVVGLERPDGQFDLHVTVEDTGIGIAEANLEAIFGEFNQVEDEANRTFEGTGLGLAITRQLVTLMGGEIWVESEPGKGSCFGFRLTLPPAEDAGPLANHRPVTLRAAVLADPSMIGRTILTRQLETCGLTVRAHRSAAEALADLSANPACDLLILDQDDGGDLERALAAARRALPDARILVASADPVHLRVADGLVDAVLQKPVLRSELFHRLQDFSAPSSAPPSASPSAPPSAAPQPRRRLRVLAAEDNRTNQLVFRKMVEGLPLDLTVVANGRQAVDHWRADRPDLIFMDISMPEMDGRASARLIREREAAEGGGAHVPIVAMTAHALQGDSDDILAAGIDHYLTKPLKKPEILAHMAGRAESLGLSLSPDAHAPDIRTPVALRDPV